MPIYEYECARCRKVSGFLVRNVQAHRAPPCPKCGKGKMSRVLSRFAAPKASKGGGGGDAAEPPAAGLGPDGPGSMGMDDGAGDLPGLEGLEGVNENDPRSLGRFMRKMASDAGEPVDAQMDEVLRRLESGEDPESIEEKMGDALESPEGGPGESEDKLYDA